jgi:hypothetical protein
VQVRRTIGWFSCGAASAIAVKLTGAQPVYCETGAEHPGQRPFLGGLRSVVRSRCHAPAVA